jgi:hypothetical protein
VTSYIFYLLDTTTNKLVGDCNISYYYSEHNFNSQITNAQINVYPNPAREYREYIVFDIKNISDSTIVEIFNHQGKKVLEEKLPVTGQIFISNLVKGSYFRVTATSNL